MPIQRRRQPQRRATKKPRTHAQPKRAKVVRRAKPSKTAVAARRVAARPAGKKNATPTGKKIAKRPATKSSTRRSGILSVQNPAAAAGGPSSHDLAVDAFERGFQALQQRQFGRAAEFLNSVVNNFADEKEMQERARVYLSICARQSGGREPKPRSFEERINAATVAINRGAFDESLTLLRKLEGDDSENDHVQYLLGVVYASTGDLDKALAHVRKAIEVVPENRIRATLDADLEPLRQNPAFATMTEVPVRRKRPAAKRR